MLQTALTPRRADLPFDRLDPQRAILLPLVYSQTRQTLKPQPSPEYTASADLQRRALKARTVLAAAFTRGHLQARWSSTAAERQRGHRWLLLGQASTLDTAPADLGDMLAAPHLHFSAETRALLPVSEEGGWRTVFGWLALSQPRDGDDRALYALLRSSQLWLTRNPGSARALYEAREMNERGFTSLVQIFANAAEG